MIEQRLTVPRPAFLVAERVDVERGVRQAVAAHELPRERDHFDVGFRSVEAEALDTELMRLAIPASLRALVTKDRTDVKEPQRA